METYIGRYLSFSCLANETRDYKEHYFKNCYRNTQSGLQRLLDSASDRFNELHKSIVDILHKLLKNKDCKEHVLRFLRLSISLNLDKQKMFTQTPVASDGFMLNLGAVLLLLCRPFTSKFNDCHVNFAKINCFYLMNDAFVAGASKLDKLDMEMV